tara:strand:- start:3740 stop:4477 length:738 start_codon:yes stop_codon:yes gene_type:complete
MASTQNKIAMVTGGATGIGAACVRLLASQGYTMVVADKNLASATAVAESIANGEAMTCDVSDPESVKDVVDRTMGRYGRLDVAVNNAGVGVPTRYNVGETSIEEWRRVLSVNLDGVFYSLHYEIPAMLENGGGSIINMASIASFRSLAGACTYTAAKHGVIGLTKTTAAECASNGIRVNAVCPGFIDTAISPRTEQQNNALAARHPIGRLGTADEVAEVVSFLASPQAGFVTGSCYLVDGGYTIL